MLFRGHQLFTPKHLFWISILKMSWYSNCYEHHLFKSLQCVCVTGSYYRLPFYQCCTGVAWLESESAFENVHCHKCFSDSGATEDLFEETKLGSHLLCEVLSSVIFPSHLTVWLNSLFVNFQTSLWLVLVVSADSEYLLLYLPGE